MEEQSEIAYYYFKNHSEYEVVSFTVDSEYKNKDTFLNLPVVDFETITNIYSTDIHEMFIAIGYRKLNSIRTNKYIEAKQKGYKLASYISKNANIYTDKIGDNCFILEDNTIQPFTSIGNNVTLWSGNHIGHHTVVEDNCFITSHVVISGGCLIGNSSFIGVNATLRDHIRIGKNNVVGAGSLLLKDTDDNNVFMASPTELSKVPSNRLRGI
ncbi:MAG: acetyltransferase [Campylobacteraceae bacterium]|nr:acetyltransferase [Campylobacteraceae bacterium]